MCFRRSHPHYNCLALFLFHITVKNLTKLRSRCILQVWWMVAHLQTQQPAWINTLLPTDPWSPSTSLWAMKVMAWRMAQSQVLQRRKSEKTQMHSQAIPQLTTLPTKTSSVLLSGVNDSGKKLVHTICWGWWLESFWALFFRKISSL